MTPAELVLAVMGAFAVAIPVAHAILTKVDTWAQRNVDNMVAAALELSELDVVAYLRASARQMVGAPGDAARRSALGQAANQIDRGIGGAFDRELDRAYRQGLAEGRAGATYPPLASGVREVRHG